MTEPRRFLLARPGQQPIYPMCGPLYKMTRTEAAEAVAYYRTIYGDVRNIVDAGPEEWCSACYPGNGSACEMPHGHAGDHSYTEDSPRSRNFGVVTWPAAQAEVRP